VLEKHYMELFEVAVRTAGLFRVVLHILYNTNMLHHEGIGIPTHSSFLRRERRIIYNIVHRNKMRQKTNNEQEELNIEYVNIR